MDQVPKQPSKAPARPLAASTAAKAPATPLAPEKPAVAPPRLAMVPQTAASVRPRSTAFVLVLGPPKSGKTTLAVGTSPQPVYCINTERDDDLLPAQDVSNEFLHNTVHSWREMEQALAVAYDLIKRKAIKTVVLDTLSSFSELLADECLAAFQTVRADGTKNLPNGKLAWPDYLKRLKHLINRLERLPAHIIVTSHFQDFSSESDDKDEDGRRIPKVGDGIVPLLYGRARLVIGGMFPNVVYLDKERDSRVLLTNIHGVWGPGSRYIKGTPKIAPDIKELIKRMKLGPA